jgi:hypothetical protein
LIDAEKMNSFELSQTAKAAIKALGFNLYIDGYESRSAISSKHQKAFRHMWRLAEQLYAGSISTIVMSTVGNAILNPALHGADFIVEFTKEGEPMVQHIRCTWDIRAWRAQRTATRLTVFGDIVSLNIPRFR